MSTSTVPEPDWRQLAFGSGSSAQVWSSLFAHLAKWAPHVSTKVLETAALDVDHLLSDAGWELWQAYATDHDCRALRTSERLTNWWAQPGPDPAVLILDALSLREVRPLLASAQRRGLMPHTVSVAGAEVPTDTNAFAKALGAGTRAALKHNGKPGNFRLSGAFTQVFEKIPFQDCIGAVGHHAKVLVWHDLIDAHLSDAHGQTHLDQLVLPRLDDDGFWNLVDHLRQGRRLVITGDHGYATKAYARSIDGPVAKQVQDVFGAMRLAPATSTFPHAVPPWVVQTHNGHHVIVGNRAWKVPGSPKEAYHGGLSLLEIAVPWIEFPAKGSV